MIGVARKLGKLRLKVRRKTATHCCQEAGEAQAEGPAEDGDTEHFNLVDSSDDQAQPNYDDDSGSEGVDEYVHHVLAKAGVQKNHKARKDDKAQKNPEVQDKDGPRHENKLKKEARPRQEH